MISALDIGHFSSGHFRLEITGVFTLGKLDVRHLPFSTLPIFGSRFWKTVMRGQKWSFLLPMKKSVWTEHVTFPWIRLRISFSVEQRNKLRYDGWIIQPFFSFLLLISGIIYYYWMWETKNHKNTLKIM